MKWIKQENKDGPSSKSKQGVQSSEIPRPESSKASCSNYGVFLFLRGTYDSTIHNCSI